MSINNLKYFQIITKKSIINGLNSIYIDAINLYNKSSNFNKPHFNIIIKKFLNGITNLKDESYEIELNKICTNNNISLDVYQSLFYNILLNNIKEISDNPQFIENIKSQLTTIKIIDFIKYCYMDIAAYLLNNELYNLLNISKNSQIDNFILSNQIDQIIIVSLYKLLNLDSIINYSKQFKDITEEDKKEENELLIENITKQINNITIEIKNMQQDLHNEIKNIKLNKEIQEQIPVNIPIIDIPVNNPSKYSIKAENNNEIKEENNEVINDKPINNETKEENNEVINDKPINNEIKEENNEIKEENNEVINDKPINNEIKEENNEIKEENNEIKEENNEIKEENNEIKEENNEKITKTTDLLQNVLQINEGDNINSISINKNDSITDMDFLNNL